MTPKKLSDKLRAKVQDKFGVVTDGTMIAWAILEGFHLLARVTDPSLYAHLMKERERKDRNDAE